MLISSPAKAWEVIRKEKEQRAVFASFVYPMIGLCALAVFLGSLFAHGWGGPESFRIAMTQCCAVAVSLFGGYFMAAFLINRLSVQLFGIPDNMLTIQEFTGYALVVTFFIQIILGLFPDIWIFGWILQFYMVYIIWEGVPVMLPVKAKDRLRFTIFSFLLLVICPALIQFIFNRLTQLLN